MDGISAAASIIALVQAGGMLFQAGVAFHDVFFSGGGQLQRGRDAAGLVDNVEDFVQKIALFRTVKGSITPPTTAESAPRPLSSSQQHQGRATSGFSAPPTPSAGDGFGDADLDRVLDRCQDQLKRLKARVDQLNVSTGANRFKQFVGLVRQKLKEPEFAEVNSTTTALLQQVSMYVQVKQLRLSLQSNSADIQRHSEIQLHHQEIKQLFEQSRQQGLDNQTQLLEMLGELVRDQLSSQEQVSAFQDSYDLLRESFEKMTISRRIERFLSGTTVVEENADGAETEAGDSGGPAAISPGLIHHPGYGFPRLNPGDIMVPRAALTRVDVWVQGTREAAVVIVGGGGGGGRGRKQAKANSNDSDNRLLCVQLPRYASDSGKAMAAAHALCTQLIKAIALRCSPGRRKLLCYNGLPPEKEPRVPGCYTIRHAVWFLTGQVLIPRPHLDGAMPPEEKAYEPHVEAVCDEIREIRVKAEEKNRHRGGGTGAELEVFIVLFLPLEKMDPAGADRELHERLIRNFKELTTQSEYIRLLLFTDDNDNGVLENFPVEAMFPFPSSGEEVSLAEWKASVGDDSDDDMDI